MSQLDGGGRPSWAISGNQKVHKMKNERKTKEQLINELAELRQRIAELEATETERKRAEEALCRQAKELTTLQATVLDITAAHDLPTLLQTIVERATRLLNGLGGGLYLCDPDREEARCVVSYNTPRDYTGTMLKYGEGAAGTVCQTGEPLVIDDYRIWPGRAAVYEEEQPFTAVLCAPMIWQGQVTGVIHVLHDVESRRFTQADLELLALFANHAAIAVENARLYEQTQKEIVERKQAEETLRRYAERLEALRQVGLELTAQLDLDALLHSIVSWALELVGGTVGGLHLYRPERDVLEWVICTEPHLAPIGSILHRGEGISGKVWETGEPLIVDDYQHWEGRAAIYEGYPWVAAVGVPIRWGEELLGVLNVDADAPRVFSPADAELLSLFATQAAIAVRNVRLFEVQREQRELAEALEEAASAVSSTLDLDQVLDRILEQVERVVAGDTFNIMLIEDNTAYVVRQRGYERLDLEEEPTSHTAISIARYPNLVRMAQTGEPALVPDTAADPDWVPGKGRGWRRSYVAAPIQASGVTVGFLNVSGARPGQFGPADVRRLQVFADHTATAIQNARLFGEMRQRVAELEALRSTSLRLTGSLDLSAVLDIIVTSALTLIGASDCHIYLYDEVNETFTFGTALWQDGRREPAVKAPRRDGLTATIARGGRPVVIDDAPRHPLYTTPEAQKWNVQAIAGFPLKRAGHVLGVFTIAFVEPHTFNEGELRVLGLLADQAAIAIENAQLYREVRSHAERLEQRVQERTAQLQAQYARLDAILRSTSDGIVVTDGQGEILQANPVAQTWLTRTLSPEDAARLRETLQDLAPQAEERPEALLELAGLDLELEAVPVSPPPSPPPPAASTRGRRRGGREGGEAAAVVVTVHDVSHLKALDRMKSRFVSSVSHELRTPVTTIKLYAYLMRQRPEKREVYLDALAQEADHLAGLVEGILQISRIDAGRLEIKPRPTSLNELTEGAIMRHQALAQERGLTLEHRLAKPGPVVLVDPGQMMQALNNLVENAIYYTPEGGKVVVSTGKEEAEGRTWATATVADTGMGIPGEELPRIFERFFRGEEPRLMQISGTGLGLAIVQEIVKLHGGQVTVESQVGKGSVFTVRLSLAASD